MINIVHTNIHLDDDRKITAIEVKLKSKNGLSGHPLIATISAAFFQTTLLYDSGNALQIVPNPERKNIVNIIVTLKETEKSLSFNDVANYLDALQKALDTTSIF